MLGGENKGWWVSLMVSLFRSRGLSRYLVYDVSYLIYISLYIYLSYTRRDQVDRTTSRSNNLFAVLEESAIDLPRKCAPM
jgi:hypothetical protein